MEKLALSVAEALLHGEENARSSQELVTVLGFSSGRELQKAIERERASGALILSSSSGGYYLPDDGIKGRAELRRYLHTLRARAIGTLRSAQAARKELQSREGEAGGHGR